MSRQDLQRALDLKDDDHFREAYLLPAIEAGLIEMTIPDRPRSSRQRCRRSEAARQGLKWQAICGHRVFSLSLDKRLLSERDICTKYITPAMAKGGWDVQTQVRENVHLTHGRVTVRGRLVSRGKGKFADYVLYYKPNVPLAIVEAKDNNQSVAAGMQQGLGYADMLDVPFVFSSNGDGFLMHDRTERAARVEQPLGLDEFPSPDELWQRYLASKDLAGTPEAQALVSQDYFSDGSDKAPRYYQVNAINRVVEAVANGQDRIVLVMATGTGKTYTAFQIIWRLWKSGAKKRILFLADRNILVDQTKTNDFKPFGGKMTKITNRKVDKSFEIFLALYQAISGTEEADDIFRQFSPDFFDLIIVDECHRGSAADNSAWRKVLDYFSAATQVGLTATPKETADISTTHYQRDQEAAAVNAARSGRARTVEPTSSPGLAPSVSARPDCASR